MPRPDGRGSPVKICGYAAACFAWRTAVSQIKHLQMLPQFNRLEQTAGKGDHRIEQQQQLRAAISRPLGVGLSEAIGLCLEFRLTSLYQ